MIPLFGLNNISKSYGRNRVLNDVSLDFHSGEIHAIVGENGAGKSTLMKILGGIVHSEEGSITKNGELVQIRNPKDSHQYGIAIIHQELSVFDNVSVAHNIFVNREPRSKLGFIDWKKMRADAEHEFSKIGIHVDFDKSMEQHSLAVHQLVEIVKALSQHAELLIMDEPTSSLSSGETEVLFELLKSLRADGSSIVFISHKLDEVFNISDRISVLRDGVLVGTKQAKDTNPDEIISMMVGRDLDLSRDHYSNKTNNEVVLSLKDFSLPEQFSNISFDLHRGEIIGVFGLVGAGRTELAHAIVGAKSKPTGELTLGSHEGVFRSPREALKEGIGYLTEDRRNDGLFLGMTIQDNIIATSVDEISDFVGIIDHSKAVGIAQQQADDLEVVPRNLQQEAKNLSGGNQQKVLLGRWLAADLKVLIIDEPTRGVDVGAKSKIHDILREMANNGLGVLMISSELPEIMQVSDRILIMHEGNQMGLIDNTESTTELEVMSHILGVKGVDIDGK